METWKKWIKAQNHVLIIKLTQRRYEYLFIQKNNNEKNSFTDKQNHCILGPFPRHMAENDYKQSTTR